MPAFMDCYGPFDYVFNCAGRNGGIFYNTSYPAQIFASNTIIGINLLDACRIHNVKKVVSLVTSCAYGDDDGYYECKDKKEKNFLYGVPNHTVECHGYAKRNILLASKYFNKEFGLNCVCACPTTIFGPRDSFDPQKTKIMGAMVKRFVDAADQNLEEVTCWGDGTPRREFIYVDDVANLLIDVMEKYTDPSLPINLGTGQEYTIKEVATMVADLAGYKGRIAWDVSKANGAASKRLSLTRMNECFGSYSFTEIEDGIRKTIEYYRGTKNGN